MGELARGRADGRDEREPREKELQHALVLPRLDGPQVLDGTRTRANANAAAAAAAGLVERGRDLQDLRVLAKKSSQRPALPHTPPLARVGSIPLSLSLGVKEKKAARRAPVVFRRDRGASTEHTRAPVTSPKIEEKKELLLLGDRERERERAQSLPLWKERLGF